MKVDRQGPNAVVCQGGPFDGQSIVIGECQARGGKPYSFATISPDEHANAVLGRYTVDRETRIATWEQESKLQERLTKTLKGVDEQVDPPPPPDPPPPIDAPDRMR